MHAQGHFAIALYVPELHREQTAIGREDVVSDHTVHVCVHHLAERVRGQPAVCDDGVPIPKIRDLERVAAPGIIVFQREESQRIQLLLFHNDNRTKILNISYI